MTRLVVSHYSVEGDAVDSLYYLEGKNKAGQNLQQDRINSFNFLLASTLAALISSPCVLLFNTDL